MAEITGKKVYILSTYMDLCKLINSVDGLDNYISGGFFTDSYREQCIKGIKCKPFVNENWEKSDDVFVCFKKDSAVNAISFEEWFARIVQNDDVIIRPKKVGIDASTICNLNCAGCYMRAKNFDGVGAGRLSVEDFVRFIEAYPEVSTIELSNNGEVFQNPDLSRILEYAWKQGKSVTLNGGVNFNYIDDITMNALVDYEVQSITIAIDGASNYVYQKYRRGGDFERVISNIKKLNQLKLQKGIDTPKLTWQYVLMDENECDIEIALALANTLNMRMMFKLDWSGRYVPKDKEFVQRVTGLKYFNRDEGGFDWSARCKDLIFMPRINWDGRLLGCCSSHSMDFGVNVFEIDLVSALNSFQYKKTIRDVFLRQVPDKSVPCGNCWIYDEKIISKR